MPFDFKRARARIAKRLARLSIKQLRRMQYRRRPRRTRRMSKEKRAHKSSLVQARNALEEILAPKGRGR